jgi:hypothetical protein
MIFGRQSARAAHHFYRCSPPIPFKKYIDPLMQNKDDATILELRCTKVDGGVGLQTVVPPSLHKETGEQIEFEVGYDKEPANVDAHVLQKAVALIAAASMLARYWPGEKSGRNEAFIALAGALARAGMPLEDAVTINRAIYRVIWGHLADLGQAEAEVKATYKKYESGGQTTGRPSLSELMDQRAVDVAFGWLGLRTAQVTSQDNAEWPKPEPMHGQLPPVEPLHPDLLPDSLRPLAEDTAERMQVVLRPLRLAGGRPISRRQFSSQSRSWVRSLGVGLRLSVDRASSAAMSFQSIPRPQWGQGMGSMRRIMSVAHPPVKWLVTTWATSARRWPTFKRAKWGTKGKGRERPGRCGLEHINW